jgi:hypothetical protein
MSDQTMRHKKKLAAMAAMALAATCAIGTHFALPRIAKSMIVSKAAQRGWSVSILETRVGWMTVSLLGVEARNAAGTSAHLESTVIQVNGTVSMSGVLTKNNESSRTNSGVKIKIDNVAVDWIMAEGTDVHASGVSFSSESGSLHVEAKTVKLNTQHGQAEIKEASFARTPQTTEAKAERVGVFVRDSAAYLWDVAAKDIVVISGHVELEATAASAALPRGMEAEQVSINCSADITNALRARFLIAAQSMSGQHKSLADKRVEATEISAAGSLTIAASDDWEVNSSVKSGNAQVDVKVQRQHKVWMFSAELPSTPCQTVLEAIPEAMRTELNDVAFDGNMDGYFVVNTLAEKDDNPFVFVRLNHKCKVASIPARIADAMAGKPFKRYIYSSSKELKEVTSGVGRSGWVSFPSVSPYMAKAVVTTEDPGFWGHHGFDMEAVRNSLRENVKDRKFTRGASTIPMQLAKNMLLTRDKTATRKLQEFFLTMIIDQKMTKDRILEMYLNIVEFGPNLYGIGPASHHYFDVDPMQLSLEQAVFLSSILPKPRASYFNSDGMLNEGKKNQIGLILDLMQRRGSITDEECRVAKEEEIRLGGTKFDSEHDGLDTSEWQVQ